ERCPGFCMSALAPEMRKRQRPIVFPGATPLRPAPKGQSRAYSLSGKRTGMAQLAVDDQDGGELDEGEVVGGLLLPAHQQAAETIEPAVAGLHDPAARRVAVRVAGWRQGLLGAALRGDVRGVAPAGGRLAAGGVVV